MADIGLQHHLQFLLRIERFLDHRFEHVQRLGEVFPQRIERQVGVFRRTGQLQPGAVVIQAFGYLAGRETHRPLAQHPVGEQGLQGEFLMPPPAAKEEVDAHHVAIACIEHMQGDAVGHPDVFRLAHRGVGGLTDDGR